MAITRSLKTILFLTSQLAWPALAENQFIWSNSKGLVSADNCQVRIDREVPFAVSEFYTSQHGVQKACEAVRDFPSLSKGEHLFDIPNFSLVRKIGAVRTNRQQVQVLGVSQQSANACEADLVKRGYGSKTLRNAPQNANKDLYLYYLSVNSPEEYAFRIHTTNPRASELEGSVLVAGTEPRGFKVASCTSGGVSSDYLIFDVYKNDRDTHPTSYVGVSLESTSLFENMTGFRNREAAISTDSKEASPAIDTDSFFAKALPPGSSVVAKEEIEDRDESDSDSNDDQAMATDSKVSQPAKSRFARWGEALTEKGQQLLDLIASLEVTQDGDRSEIGDKGDPLPMPVWEDSRWNTHSETKICTLSNIERLATYRLAGSTPSGKVLFENLRDEKQEKQSKLPVFSIIQMQKDAPDKGDYSQILVKTLSQNSWSMGHDTSRLGETGYLHQKSIYDLTEGAFKFSAETPTSIVPGVSEPLIGSYAVISLDDKKVRILSCEEGKEAKTYLIFDQLNESSEKQGEFAVGLSDFDLFAAVEGLPRAFVGQPEAAWALDPSEWPDSVEYDSAGANLLARIAAFSKTTLPENISKGAHWFVSTKKRSLCRSNGGSYCSPSGYCLRGVKWALIKANLFSGYPGGVSAYAFGPALRGVGMTNIYNDAEMNAQIKSAMANVPAGCVTVYGPTAKARARCSLKKGRNCGGDKHGHIEIRTTAGKYISDFIQRTHMRDMNGKHRVVTGVYCKL